MGKASPAVAAFVGGEWAPQMESRSDVEKYAVAAHICQNFIPTKQGPAMYRAGSVFVQPVKNSQNRTWLYPFQFAQSSGNSFLIEFGDKYVRFYANHGPLLSVVTTAWNSGTAYALGAQVNVGGVVYVCILANTNQTPPNSTYWYPLTPYQGSTSTGIYEIPSPYAAADLVDSFGQFTLQIAQQGDVLYLAGGNAGAGYQPYTLTRYANAPPNWQFALYAPTDGPFANAVPLVPGSEIAMTVSAAQGTGITINAWGGSVFAPTDVGRLVRIQSGTFNVTPWQGQTAFTVGATVVNNGNNYTALNTATSGINAPVVTSGSQSDGPGGVLWLYTDSGYGVAQITGYSSPTVVTANVLKRFPANVVNTTGAIAISAATQANPCVLTTATQAFTTSEAVFVEGVLGMTQLNQIPLTVQSATSTTVTLAGIDSTTYPAYISNGFIVGNASVEWQLGAWSNTTEWPRAVAFFKDRLFWGGKLNIWGSVPGLYNSHTPDFFGQQTTDSAMNELVSGADASNICWLSPAVILLIGTEGGEYGLDSANYSTSPLGPANVEILRQSQWRCRAIHPFLVGVTLVYVQRAGRKVLAADYNFYLNRYDSTDQSKFAYHMSIGGITGVAYQQEPFSLMWCTRSDGTLLSYTFNREDNVTAWARHNLGGNGVVESIAAINAPDGSRDELWLIVNRTINGVTARYVEYFAKHYEGPQAGNAGDAQSSAWYVDCGSQLINTPAPGATTTTVTGLQYLSGQLVSIWADGGVQPQQIVPPSGTITIAGAFHTITIGLPYQGNLVPMRFEGGADVGTAQGKLKQGANLVLRLVDSFGGVVGQLSDQNAASQIYQNPLGLTTQTLTNVELIRYNLTTTGLDMPPNIQSGDFPTSFPHQPNSDSDARDFYILVQQSQPAPMTVVGLYPSYKVEDNQ